ncbi:hypothetical protein BKA70DRAFT_1421398 [Coprinopsis sp. MPI-PUGE-AT-0042]|nr:hypothetical protein BKA70DRAFT_1421398 [Coprinopsis sp. MPI-PUGE-AT-0042]
MSNNNTRTASPPHSIPIPISNARHARHRSASMSSSASSSTSDALPPTPPGSGMMGSQRVSIPSPSQSPILSYFYGQSPTKSTSPMTASSGTFPFRRGFAPPAVFEEEEEQREIPVAAHARRTSVTVANRFSSAQATPAAMPDALHDRGAGLLRRLSLSAGGAPSFAKPNTGRSPPSPPPNSAINTQGARAPGVMGKPRRSATVSESRPRRAPSPMGERILKGHFDGFN